MNIQALFDASLKDARAGRFPAAEKKLLRLLKQPLNKPDAANVRGLLGTVYGSMGKHRAAVGVLTKACDANPDDATLASNLCSCLIKTGRFADAVAAGQKAVAIAPADPDSRYILGNAYKEAGEFENAVSSYRQALELQPGNPAFHNSLGNAFFELGDLDSAVASYEKALELNPDHAPACNNLGNALRNLGDAEGAAANFSRVISLDPEFAAAHNNLGHVYRDRGDLENAAKSYQKALEIASDYTAARANIGHACRDAGKYRDAIAHYDQANTRSSRAEALRCLYALGDYETFYQRIEKTRKLDGTNTGVAAICTFVSDQLGRDNPHPFCPHPIDFLYFGELRPHVDDTASFIDTLLKELVEKPSVWEPISKTTHKGYQTKANLFDHPTGHLARLENILKEEIGSYRARFADEDCLFISSWPENSSFMGWSVRLQTEGHQTPHIHAGGWLSGVVYLKLVEPSGDPDEGAIVFGPDGYDLPLLTDDVPRRLHRPKQGDIVLFPSSLFHQTVPIKNDGERIILAFDLIPATR